MEEVKLSEDVKFDPFDPEHHREPTANIVNISAMEPVNFLDLFIPTNMYVIIAENTNLYAIAKNVSTAPTKSNTRYWWPTCEDEIWVLFGIWYYMGVHREPSYTIYWERPKPNGPIHSISQHMTLNRYENLHRYFHVSPPKPTESPSEPPEPSESYVESRQPQEPSHEAQEDPEVSEDKENWWWKLEPMLSTFRTACQHCLIPGTEVAIDEIMVRFHDRSGDTCKMPNKPIKQGYKIFALADDGYIWHFQLSSRWHGIEELEKVNELTPTGSMVLQMM